MGHSAKIKVPVFEQGLHDALPAIERLIEVAGGPTALGIRVGTSGQSIANLRVARRVSNSALAHLMADAATALEEPTITSRVLAGIDPWKTAGTGERGERQGKGRSASSPPKVADIGRLAEAGMNAKLANNKTSSRRKPSAPAQNRTGTRETGDAEEGLKDAA